MELKADVSEAADTVMTDRGHLDPNPIPISKQDVVKCLEDIKEISKILYVMHATTLNKIHQSLF